MLSSNTTNISADNLNSSPATTTLEYLNLEEELVPLIETTTQQTLDSLGENYSEIVLGETLFEAQEQITKEMLYISSEEASRITHQDVAMRLQVGTKSGITNNEVSFRRRMTGWNELSIGSTTPLWLKYIEQFKDPMIILLLISAVVSLIMRQFDDSFSITIAILIVVTVAFIQEYRSEKSLDALKRLVPHKCHVLRHGKPKHILARELVPGDIVLLQSGDRVPADLRLFEIHDLSIDESGFTGETKVSHKITQTLEVTTGVADRVNVAYMGTLVRTGSGKGIVVSVAEQSEFGEIFRAMQDEESPKTPLQKNMSTLGKQLSFVSLAIIGLILLLGWFQGRPLLEMFTIAVSLAVAAIPEGLPIVVTVTLALGMMRMAAKQAIVKKLPTVETLGCATVVCSDKTGTLTRNEMNVSHIYTSLHRYLQVDHDTDKILDDKGVRVNVQSLPDLEALLLAAIICNNAIIQEDGILLGQSTEGAIIVFAHKLGLVHLKRSFRRLDEQPFSSESKKMSVLAANTTEPIKHIWYVKGALESVLPMCQFYYGSKQKLQEIDIKEISEIAEKMGSNSLRVLAVAQGAEYERLSFLGLFGLKDPLRPGVRNSVRTLIDSGVQVKLLTGDSRETAISVARDVGLFATSYEIIERGDFSLSGEQISSLEDSLKIEAINRATVFYRVSPKHKISIVRCLQARNHIVAMTGDGTNDAIAIKGADIGLAMGKSGTDVCREAGDMILLNDNFSTILAAIEEGKGIFYNIRNFLRFQMSTSIAAISLIAISTFAGLPNPLNAMQILWINIIMDGPPAQSLGVEPVDKDVMKKPPREVTKAVLSMKIILSAILNAIVIVSGVMWIYRREMQDNLVTSRDTTMSFTCFVFFDMFNAFSCRSQDKSVFSLGLFTNVPLWIAIGFSIFGQFLVIYWSFLQKVFQTEALSLSDICTLILIASTVLIIDEIKKLIIRCCRKRGQKSASPFNI